MRIEVMRGHTKSFDANDKLIQTRSHERDTLASKCFSNVHCAIFICLKVLHKNICLHFFIFILLSVLIFYVFVSLSSVSPS